MKNYNRAKSAPLTNREKWAVWRVLDWRIRTVGSNENRVLAVCGGERGGFAVVMYFACLCAYGWGNMTHSSRCIPRP